MVKRLFRLPLRRRDLTEATVEQELRHHLELRVERLVAQGMAPDEARREAERRFGAEEGRRRVRAAALRRERRMGLREWAGGVAQDLRLGARRLREAPGFAAAALVTLAVGIGAATAVFSVVEGVLLRPLPFPEPERLVRVFEVTPEGEDHNVVSPANFLAWRDAGPFAAVGAHHFPFGASLTGGADAVRVSLMRLHPAVMEAVGLDALVGRRLIPEDTAVGDVAVLSHTFWRGHYGSDRGVVGRTLTINQTPLRVVGVMPPEFRLPTPEPDVYVPIAAGDLNPEERRGHMLYVVGRLAPGASVASAEAALGSVAANLAREYPGFMEGWSVNVEPLQADLTAGARPLLVALMAAGGVMLLLACANLANLLLARAVGRDREMAVRAALGAGRSRLVRQLLTEGLLLAAAGGSLGVLVALAATPLLLGLAPAEIPRLDGVAVDGTALLFAAAATVLSTLVFALLPAVRLSGTEPGASLGQRGAGPARGQSRLRATFMVTEMALAMVLLAAAGLLVRSALELQRVDLGYETAGLAAASLDLPPSSYGGVQPVSAFYDALARRIAALPGVSAVTGTTEPPVEGYGMTFSFAIRGRPAATPSGREDDEQLRVVLPGYFETLDIPIVEGRGLEMGDGPGTPPVVVLDRTLADKHWPDGGAVGAHISFEGPDGPWWEVVGVAGATRMAGAEHAPVPAIYLPHAQRTWSWMTWLTLLVRTDDAVDPMGLAPGIRGALKDLDPDVPLHDFTPVDRLYAEGLARSRFALLLMGTFAGVALVLGAVGLYGVVSYTVGQRQQELGIRKALGAGRGEVLRAVFGHAFAMAGLGILLGTALALVGARMLESVLYGVPPHDPLTLGAVALVLAGVAAAATTVPALRAAGTDPATVLRQG